jgi:hypothetical protein
VTVAITAISDLSNLLRKALPGGSHIAHRAANPSMTDAVPTTRPTEKRPRSNERNICVSERRESQSRKPGLPAAVKSSTQEPMVKASATIAAVAALSETDAANNASAPIKTA